jgi:hypothetical protein
VPDLYYLATIVTFAGVVALVVMAVVAMRRHEGQHRRSSDALWDDLRRAHGLSRDEARYLRATAERAALGPEALIFIEPHALMRLSDKDPESQAMVGELMSKLYSIGD